MVSKKFVHSHQGENPVDAFNNILTALNITHGMGIGKNPEKCQNGTPSLSDYEYKVVSIDGKNA